MLDNSETDPPVLWDVRFHTDAMMDRDAFAAYVQHDPHARPAPDDAAPAADDCGIRVFFRVSTWAQADALATELFEKGRQRFRTTPPSGGWWSSAGASVYPHAPDAPVRFG